MSFTLEVKPGRSREVIWLDLSQCKVLRVGTQTMTVVTSDGRCFDILKGKRRKHILEIKGYDPDAIYSDSQKKH
jgi:hypothetical protein